MSPAVACRVVRATSPIFTEHANSNRSLLARRPWRLVPLSARAAPLEAPTDAAEHASPAVRNTVL
jgi:hypothetical protein